VVVPGQHIQQLLLPPHRVALVVEVVALLCLLVVVLQALLVKEMLEVVEIKVTDMALEVVEHQP
jgi:hypothetical protein